MSIPIFPKSFRSGPSTDRLSHDHIAHLSGIMGSTVPPHQDAQNPYHIPPTYFANTADSGRGDGSASAHPSSSTSRRLSRQPAPGRDALQSMTESDMFRDAEDEGESGDYDLGRDLLAFDPPPPRTGPQYPYPQHGSSSLASPYRSSTLNPSSTPPSALSAYSNGLGPSADNPAGTGSASPRRDHLPSSSSVSSMSSALKGRRAPAPAALDLSPRRNEGSKRNQYEGLGYGTPLTEGRRVMTDSMLDSVSAGAAVVSLSDD